MTEEEKNEFEEFLQWKKEKQEEEKQKLQQTKEHIETLEDSNGEYESNNASPNQGTLANQPRNKKKEATILWGLCFFTIVLCISQFVAFNKSETSTGNQYMTENEYDPLKAIHDSVQQVNPAKRNVLDLKNETCKNREKRNVQKISHTRHFKAIKKQSVLGCFYSF